MCAQCAHEAHCELSSSRLKWPLCQPWCCQRSRACMLGWDCLMCRPRSTCRASSWCKGRRRFQGRRSQWLRAARQSGPGWRGHDSAGVSSPLRGYQGICAGKQKANRHGVLCSEAARSQPFRAQSCTAATHLPQQPRSLRRQLHPICSPCGMLHRLPVQPRPHLQTFGAVQLPPTHAGLHTGTARGRGRVQLGLSGRER